jgi:hypothetical protein
LFFYQGIALELVDTASSRSDLETVELNVRRRLGPRLAVLGGLRFLELTEHLDFALQSSANQGYFSQTDNRLTGFQLGVEGVLPARGYGRLFAGCKYGIYNNHFQVTAQAIDGSGAPLRLDVPDDMVAFVGDFNAGFEVQTVPCCTLRCGYQALWITNAALSIDQLNQYDIFGGSGGVSKGTPIYHGAFLGAVFTF